jgi:hypothetical protein
METNKRSLIDDGFIGFSRWMMLLHFPIIFRSPQLSLIAR